MDRDHNIVVRALKPVPYTARTITLSRVTKHITRDMKTHPSCVSQPFCVENTENLEDPLMNYFHHIHLRNESCRDTSIMCVSAFLCSRF